MAAKLPNGQKRAFDRVRAMALAPVAAPMLAGELVIALSAALKADGPPALYMLASAEAPEHDFTVWRGAETTTDELRAMLAAGLWPGPSNTPRPSQLVRAPVGARIAAVTLWGEGATEPGPWEALWRDRGVRHGLYAGFVAPSGRVAIMLMSRGSDAPAFTSADTAFVAALSPTIEAAMDAPDPPEAELTAPADIAQLHFTSTGELAGISAYARELLRDMGGGGAGAGGAARADITRAVQAVVARPMMPESERERLYVAGPPSERAMRQAAFAFFLDRANLFADLQVLKPLCSNEFGRFELRVAPLITQAGETQWIATIVRRVQPMLLALRGVAELGAPGREIELLRPLAAGASIDAAAMALGVSAATARTLIERLTARAGANGARDLWRRLQEIGRSALR